MDFDNEYSSNINLFNEINFKNHIPSKQYTKNTFIECINDAIDNKNQV